MRPLPKIMVAPSGARLSKADHPALPLTIDEVVTVAKSCFEVGADGLHAHIRNEDGSHLLDAAVYRDLLSNLRRAVPDMALQITTEAAGVYQPDVQMEVALNSGADMVSAAVREIGEAGLETARAFYAECEDRKIAVQHILFDVEDCQRLSEILPRTRLSDPKLQMIFVLGRYSQTGASSPNEMLPFLTWLKDQNLTPDWAVCAFGAAEPACLVEAARRGGKCRVGFENSRLLSNGSVAKDNREKVVDLCSQLTQQNLLL